MHGRLPAAEVVNLVTTRPPAGGRDTSMPVLLTMRVDGSVRM